MDGTRLIASCEHALEVIKIAHGTPSSIIEGRALGSQQYEFRLANMGRTHQAACAVMVGIVVALYQCPFLTLHPEDEPNTVLIRVGEVPPPPTVLRQLVKHAFKHTIEI